MASGETLYIWSPLAAEYPSASPGTPNLRNNHPIIEFGSNNLSVRFTGILPRHYDGGGITVSLHVAHSGTTNNVAYTTAFKRIGDQQQDTDSDSFATGVTCADTAVPGVSGNVDIIAVAHTDGAEIDSIAVGDLFRLTVTRVAAGVSDAGATAQLFGVELKES